MNINKRNNTTQITKQHDKHRPHEKWELTQVFVNGKPSMFLIRHLLIEENIYVKRKESFAI